MVNLIKRFINNQRGRLSGYGSCSECGDTWNWKGYQDIKYDDWSGMFPLCRECFNRLPNETIEDHCIAIMVSWGKSEGEIKKYLSRIVKEIIKIKNE